MSIKKVLLASWNLYRQSFPQIWHLGVITGMNMVLLLFMNAFYKANITLTTIAISIVAILVLSLVFVYLSSLLLLKLYNISNEQNISWQEAQNFVKTRYIKVVLSLSVVFVINFIGTLAFMAMFIINPNGKITPLFLGILALILFAITQVLFSMTHPLVLLDNNGVIKSILNSCKLVWSRWWPTFVIVFPLAFISYLLNFAITYATSNSRWDILIYGGLVSMLFYPLFYSLILLVFKQLKLPKN